jgi:cutinase
MHELTTRPALRHRAVKIVAAATVGAAGLVTLAALTATGSSAAAACSDVDVVFARGTGEPQGLGSVGSPFVATVQGALPGRSVSTYAVVYAANTSQTSAAPGSTDLTNHLTSVAASCPATTFILGGYSQGATVVDKSLGIQTGSGTGTVIPAALASRVDAAVAFGNPLGLQGKTIATASPTYGARSKDYCNTGDPVCGNGNNTAAHLQYASNGSAAAGGRFAASLVPATTPTPTPTTSPAPTPTTSPTGSPTSAPPSSTCVRASTRDHVAAGRATALYGRAYAVGTRDSLGPVSAYTVVSLRGAANSWSKVAAC